MTGSSVLAPTCIQKLMPLLEVDLDGASHTSISTENCAVNIDFRRSYLDLEEACIIERFKKQKKNLKMQDDDLHAALDKGHNVLLWTDQRGAGRLVPWLQRNLAQVKQRGHSRKFVVVYPRHSSTTEASILHTTASKLLDQSVFPQLEKVSLLAAPVFTLGVDGDGFPSGQSALQHVVALTFSSEHAVPPRLDICTIDNNVTLPKLDVQLDEKSLAGVRILLPKGLNIEVPGSAVPVSHALKSHEAYVIPTDDPDRLIQTVLNSEVAVGSWAAPEQSWAGDTEAWALEVEDCPLELVHRVLRPLVDWCFPVSREKFIFRLKEGRVFTDCLYLQLLDHKKGDKFMFKHVTSLMDGAVHDLNQPMEQDEEVQGQEQMALSQEEGELLPTLVIENIPLHYSPTHIKTLVTALVPSATQIKIVGRPNMLSASCRSSAQHAQEAGQRPVCQVGNAIITIRSDGQGTFIERRETSTGTVEEFMKKFADPKKRDVKRAEPKQPQNGHAFTALADQ